MILKIDHINISVTNLEESQKFFTNLFGFEIEHQGELSGSWLDDLIGHKNAKATYCKLILAGRSTSIELIEYAHPQGSKDQKMCEPMQIGFRHLALEVNDIELQKTTKLWSNFLFKHPN